MARVRSRVAAHARHKKILNLAEGHRGKRRTNFKLAHESVQHALKYATDHRRDKKGDFRRLWIVRINAAARLHDLTYGRLMDGLKKAGITPENINGTSGGHDKLDPATAAKFTDLIFGG